MRFGIVYDALQILPYPAYILWFISDIKNNFLLFISRISIFIRKLSVPKMQTIEWYKQREKISLKLLPSTAMGIGHSSSFKVFQRGIFFNSACLKAN